MGACVSAISGSMEGIEAAIEELTRLGAKRALKLQVGGAFHSPLMEPARKKLGKAIEDSSISEPDCPVYQNVSAEPETDPDKIRENLLLQLTAPVRWTQTVRNMIRDGAGSFTEVGPGKVLQGLIRKTDPGVMVASA